MKRTALLIVISVLMTCSFISCDLLTDLRSSATRLSFRADLRGTTPGDTVVFTGREIRTFNGITGEVIFDDTTVIRRLKSFHKIKCYLGNDSLFTFTTTSDIMSSIVNDLVLNHSLYEGKFYFGDGYPDHVEQDNPIRLQNKQNRTDSWAKFIKQLKTEGRYIEE